MANGLGNVWVIGASSGIGEAFARLIGRDGTRVAISARSAEKLDAIASSESSIEAFPVDITDEKAVSGTASAVEDQFGSIDLLVVCSGYWANMPSDNLDLEKMKTAMAVNFLGAANAVSAVIPGMKERGRGHIVLVASVAGYRGLPRAGAYGPTKAALMNFAETLKVDLASFGIDVSVVNPGFVDTPMTSTNKFAMPQMITADQAARHMLDGIKKNKFAIVFPFPFASLVRLSAILPNWFFFWGMRRMTGK